MTIISNLQLIVSIFNQFFADLVNESNEFSVHFPRYTLLKLNLFAKQIVVSSLNDQKL